MGPRTPGATTCSTSSPWPRYRRGRCPLGRGRHARASAGRLCPMTMTVPSMGFHGERDDMAVDSSRKPGRIRGQVAMRAPAAGVARRRPVRSSEATAKIGVFPLLGALLLAGPPTFDGKRKARDVIAQRRPHPFVVDPVIGVVDDDPHPSDLVPGNLRSGIEKITRKFGGDVAEATDYRFACEPERTFVVPSVLTQLNQLGRRRPSLRGGREVNRRHPDLRSKW